MRVLWFSNTVPLVSNTGIGCSWIGSLEMELSKLTEIELGICFNSNQPFISEGPQSKKIYYPIAESQAKSKFNKIIDRWKRQIKNENHARYLEVIEKFKPDVIHIFGTESDYGLIISKIKIPCIIHLQGIITVVNQKWFNSLSMIDVLEYSKKLILIKAEGFYHEYFFNKKIVKRENTIFKSCKYFMGRTDWDRRVTSILSPGSKYFHCDEIIRSEFYAHQWKHPETKTFTLISTMRGNIYKGLETILECQKILKQNFPFLEISWKIAGLKTDDEISILVQRKYKVDFKDFDIQLLGPLAENELIQEMFKANLFVHASHIENSSNSICEAMLLGMPVIATAVGGTSSIIENKKDGILIQDGDPYVLAGAIIEIKKNTEFAKSLGNNARFRALIRHNPSKIVNNLLGIYSNILN